MHIYFDEAGNCAPFSQPSATQYFVLAALVVQNYEVVEQAIQQFRQRLSFNQEFKSHKTSLEIRLALLKMSLNLQISFNVMVVNKQSLSGEWQHQNSMTLYQAIASEFLIAVAKPLVGATLIIDEIDRHQTDILKKQVQLAVNSDKTRRIKKVRGHNSRRDNLLQLADVVVGSVFRAKERGDDRCLAVMASQVCWYHFSGEKR